MKLRIQDNSIRVRLSIEELEELKNRKETFMVSYLGPSPLTTRIIAVEDGSTVSFDGDEIRLFLTAKSISDLYNSDKEGIYLYLLQPGLEQSLLNHNESPLFSCSGKVMWGNQI